MVKSLECSSDGICINIVAPQGQIQEFKRGGGGGGPAEFSSKRGVQPFTREQFVLQKEGGGGGSGLPGHPPGSAPAPAS